MDNKEQEIFDAIDPPPKKSVFIRSHVETLMLPHPYCITSKHLQFGDSTILDGDAIERAEAKGAVCDICRKQKKGPILTYREHEKNVTLFIRVPQNKDLNAVKGLHAYLLQIKEKATKLGVQGFAFPLLQKGGTNGKA